VQDLREKIKIKDETKKVKRLKKAKKHLSQAINKAKNELKTKGI